MSIRDHIVVPSVRDPNHPEFPPESPRYPATPAQAIDFGGRKILIKDESLNPTGSHKDRWAWELIVRYKSIIDDILEGRGRSEVPRYSIISSGSAALALQTQLRLRGLPDLHVLMDRHHTDPRVPRKLSSIGARVTLENLGGRELSNEDVLALTKNPSGEDVTTRDLLTPYKERFYDWLVYEILSLKPRHIFVPVGTGDLFANLVFILNEENEGWRDARLPADADVSNISVYGATTDRSDSCMTMLYAPFRPTLSELKVATGGFAASGVVGPRSGIFNVEDDSARYATEELRKCLIRSDPSGAAGLALLVEKMTDIPEGERIVVINTGCMQLPAAADA